MRPQRRSNDAGLIVRRARGPAGRLRALALLGCFGLGCFGLGGCLGKGGAVSVRWRIVERATGTLRDPRDVSDQQGVCCQNRSDRGECAGQPGWRVTRVLVVLTDPTTGTTLPDPPAGLEAPCNARELTTPFELPDGLFAINLRAFDPAAPLVVEAESPSPELRVVRAAEIVNLDIVELSVTSPP